MNICITLESSKNFQNFFSNLIPQVVDNNLSADELLKKIYDITFDELVSTSDPVKTKEVIIQHLFFAVMAVVKHNETNMKAPVEAKYYKQILEYKNLVAESIFKEDSVLQSMFDLFKGIVSKGKKTVPFIENPRYNAVSLELARTTNQVSIFDNNLGFKINITAEEKKLYESAIQDILSLPEETIKLKLVHASTVLNDDRYAVFNSVQDGDFVLVPFVSSTNTEYLHQDKIPIFTFKQFAYELNATKEAKIDALYKQAIDLKTGETLEDIESEVTALIDNYVSIIAEAKSMFDKGQDVFFNVNLKDSSKGFVEFNRNKPTAINTIPNVDKSQISVVFENNNFKMKLNIPFSKNPLTLFENSWMNLSDNDFEILHHVLTNPNSNLYFHTNPDKKLRNDGATKIKSFLSRYFDPKGSIGNYIHLKEDSIVLFDKVVPLNELTIQDLKDAAFNRSMDSVVDNADLSRNKNIKILNSASEVTQLGQWYRDGENVREAIGPRLKMQKASYVDFLRVEDGTLVMGNDIKQIDFIYNNTYTSGELTGNGELKGGGAYISFVPYLAPQLTLSDIDEDFRFYSKSLSSQLASNFENDSALEWFKNNPLSQVVKLMYSSEHSDKGPEFLASYLGAVISMYKGSENVLLYHESFHAFWNGILSAAERSAIISDLRGLSGSFTVTVAGKTTTVDYANATELQLEEYLAEEFRAYATEKSNVSEKSEKVKSFFAKILDALKAFFKGSNYSELVSLGKVQQITNPLFSDLYSGNFDISKFNPSLDVNPKWASFSKEISENDIVSFSIGETNLLMDSMNGLVSLTMSEVFSFANDSESIGKLLTVLHKMQSVNTSSKEYKDLELSLNSNRGNIPTGNSLSILTSGNALRVLSSFVQKSLQAKLDLFKLEQKDNPKNTTLKYKIETLEKALRPEVFGDVKELKTYIDNKDKSTILGLFLNESALLKPIVQQNNFEEDFENESFETNIDLENEDSLVNNEVFVLGADQYNNDLAELKTINVQTKLLLSYVPEHQFQGLGGIQVNNLGLPKLRTLNYMYFKVMSLLKNSVDAEEMNTRLKHAAKTDNELAYVYKILGDYNSENSDNNLWNDFYHSFDKYNTPLRTVIATKTNTFKTENDKQVLDKSTLELYSGQIGQDTEKVIGQWRSSFNFILESDSDYVMEDEVTKEKYLDLDLIVNDFMDPIYSKHYKIDGFNIITSDNLNGISRTGYSTKVRKAIYNAVPFLKELGINIVDDPRVWEAFKSGDSSIDFNTGVLDFFVDHLVNRLNKTINGKPDLNANRIYKFDQLFSEFTHNTNGIERKSNQTAALKQLAKLHYAYSNDTGTFMQYNANGDKQNSMSYPSSLYNMVKIINDSQNYHDLVTIPGFEFLDMDRNALAETYSWLRAMFDVDGDGKRNPKVKITVELLAGSKLVENDVDGNNVQTSDIGSVSRDLDPISKYLSDIVLTLDNRPETPRAEAKSTSATVSGFIIKKSTGEIRGGSTLAFSVNDAIELEKEGYDKQHMTDLFFDALAAELIRINLIKNLDKTQALNFDADFLNKGEQFQFFDAILSDDLKGELGKLNIQNRTDLLNAFDNNDSLANSFESEMMKFVIDRRNALELNNFEVTYPKTLLDRVRKNNSEDEVTLTSRLLLVFVVNNTVSTLNYSQLFLGDLSNYDLAGEGFQKRIAGLISTGKGFRYDGKWLNYLNEDSYGLTKKHLADKGLTLEGTKTVFDSYLNTAVIQDKETTSASAEYFRDFLGIDESSYRDMKEADGQGWLSFDAYRLLKKSTNEWSDAQENLYQKIIKDEPLNSNDIRVTFPVVKFQYYGPVYGSSESLPLQLNSFHKYSLAPLIPMLIKNTPLEKMHEKMMEQGIDYVTVKSASKLTDISNVVFENGKWVNKTDVFYNNDREVQNGLIFTKNQIHLRFLKNQLYLAEGYKGKITLPTQIRKIGLLGLFDGGVPTDFKVESVNEATVKAGVQELFDSNPELANAVYEALGFSNEKELEQLKKEFSSFSNIKDKFKGDLKNVKNLVDVFTQIGADVNFYKPFATGISEQRKKNIILGKATSYIWEENFDTYRKTIKKSLTDELKSEEDRYNYWFDNDTNFYTLDVESGKYYKYNSNATFTPLEKKYEITKKEYYEALDDYKNDLEQKNIQEQEDVKENALRQPFLEGRIVRLFDNHFVIVTNHIIKEEGDSFVNEIEFIYYDEFDYDRLQELEKQQITPQQKQQALQIYSQYLDTIFPDSEVKDIVYHGTRGYDRTTGKELPKFEKFDKETIGKSNGLRSDDMAKGFYFGSYKIADRVGTRIIPAILNITDVNNTTVRRNTRDFDVTGDVFVAFEPEQIHILGSKQDLESFKEFVDHNDKKTINRKEAWEALTESEKMNQSKNYNWYTRYIQKVNQIEKYLLDQLKEDLGIKLNPETNLYEGNPEKLISYLKESLTNKELLEDEIQSLIDKNTGKLIDDLSFSVHAATIEKLLIQMTDKKLRRLKINGEPLVQVSGSMYEQMGLTLVTDVEGKIRYGSNQLRFYHAVDKDGNIVTDPNKKDEVVEVAKMEVMIALQGDYEKLFLFQHSDGDKIKVVSNGELDYNASLDRLNEMLEDEVFRKEVESFITLPGVRIPTQSTNSLTVPVVKKFLPYYAGPIVILPVEIVAQSGGDFDVDKIFSMMKNIVTINGKPEIQQYIENVTESKEFLKEQRDTLNSSLSSAYEELDLLYDQRRIFWEESNLLSAEVSAKIKKQYGLTKDLYQTRKELYGYIKAADKGIWIFKDVSPSERQNESIKYQQQLENVNQIIEFQESEIKRIMFDELGVEVATDFYNYNDGEIQKIESRINDLNLEKETVMRKFYGSSIKGLENDLMDLFAEKLTMGQHFKDLVTANTTKDAKGMADNILNEKQIVKGEYNKREKGYSKNQAKQISNTEPLMYEYNLQKFKENFIGIESLGIAAVVSTYHAMFSIDENVFQENSPEKNNAFEKAKKKVALELSKGTPILKLKNELEIVSKYLSKSLLIPSNKNDKNQNYFGAENNIYGQNIADLVSQLINGYVDVGKDAWVFLIEGNKENTPVLLTMLLAGVPFNDAVRISTHPLVKEYTRIKQSLKGVFSNMTDEVSIVKASNIKKLAQDRLVKKFLSDLTLGLDFNTINNLNDVEFTSEELEKLSTSNSSPTKRDLELFAQYLHLEKIADEMTNVTAFTKFDTTKMSSVNEIQSRIDDTNSYKRKSVDDKFLGNAIVDNLMKSVSGAFNQDVFNVHLFDKQFKIRNSKALTNLSLQLKNKDIPKGFNLESVRNQFKNDFVFFLYQNSVYSSDELTVVSEDGSLETYELKVGKSEEIKIENGVIFYNPNFSLAYEISKPEYHHIRGYFIESLAPNNFQIKNFIAFKMTYEKLLTENINLSLEDFKEKFKHFDRSANPLSNSFSGEAYRRVVLQRAAMFFARNPNSMFDTDLGVVPLINRLKELYPEIEQYSLITDLKWQKDKNKYNIYFPNLNSNPEQLKIYKEDLQMLSNHPSEAVRNIFNVNYFSHLGLMQTGLSRNVKNDFVRIGNPEHLNNELSNSKLGDKIKKTIQQIEINYVNSKKDNVKDEPEYLVLNQYLSMFKKLLATNYRGRNNGVNYTISNPNLVDTVIDTNSSLNRKAYLVSTSEAQYKTEDFENVENLADFIETLSEMDPLFVLIQNEKIVLTNPERQEQLDNLLDSKLNIDNRGPKPKLLNRTSLNLIDDPIELGEHLGTIKSKNTEKRFITMASSSNKILAAPVKPLNKAFESSTSALLKSLTGDVNMAGRLDANKYSKDDIVWILSDSLVNEAYAGYTLGEYQKNIDKAFQELLPKLKAIVEGNATILLSPMEGIDKMILDYFISNNYNQVTVYVNGVKYYKMQPYDLSSDKYLDYTVLKYVQPLYDIVGIFRSRSDYSEFKKNLLALPTVDEKLNILEKEFLKHVRTSKIINNTSKVSYANYITSLVYNLADNIEIGFGEFNELFEQMLSRYSKKLKKESESNKQSDSVFVKGLNNVTPQNLTFETLSFTATEKDTILQKLMAFAPNVYTSKEILIERINAALLKDQESAISKLEEQLNC